MSASKIQKRIAIENLNQKKKRGEKIVSLTAYDYITAQVLDEVGVDFILVGDSLGMVVLGYPDTLLVTVDDMIRHSQAVVRGTKQSMVVVDMPFLSYGVSDEKTIENAGRMIRETGAQAVKLEGGVIFASAIQKMVNLGIPVLGHIGMTPTHVLVESGYHMHGKTALDRQRLLEDAKALEKAGAWGIVLECVDPALAREISLEIHIPTIGIGSGQDCDGQILVSHDLLGLYEDLTPKFVKKYGDLRLEMKRAFAQYKKEVKERQFPAQ